MYDKAFPVIDLIATGDNIRRLRLERGFSVRDLQRYFGFDQPQAIYKWQKGACLPTVDNLYALGNLFGVPMDQILIPMTSVHLFLQILFRRLCQCDKTEATACFSNSSLIFWKLDSF